MFVKKMTYFGLLLLSIVLIVIFAHEYSLQRQKELEKQERIANQKQEAEEQRKTIDTLIASAKGGSPDAQKDLGDAYYYGRNTDINFQEAEHWWEKAANQGNVAAQFNLGTFYLYDFLHQDFNKAVSWLEKATTNGDKDAPEQLRIAEQKKVDIDQLEATKRVTITVKGENKNGNLTEAAGNANLEEVKRLLDKRADVNAKDKDGDTALMCACENGNLKVVRLLFDKGADANAKGDDGSTALIRACEKGNLEVAKLLLARGADVNAKGESGRTPLIMTCIGSMDKQLEVIKLLLKNGCGVDIKDNYNETALMHAAATNNPKIVKLLIDKGANVTAAGDGGYTVLMVAAQHDSPQVVKLVLDKGADVNAKSGTGATALMFASLHGNLQIAKLLLDKGADVNAKNIDGRTVIQCASSHPEMVNFLKTVADMTYVTGEGGRMCIVARNLEVMQYAALLDYQGDREAFLKALQQGLRSGEFVGLKKGTKCFVIRPIIDVSWCLIRPEGDPDMYYAPRGDFSPRPGGQAKE